MTISGNVKFFDENSLDDNATYTFTSAPNSLSSYLYDNSSSTKLTSSGSDDVTDEVYLVEFASSKTIDRIFVRDHNIKAGKIEYWNGAAYVDFSTAISWSGNTDTSNYYEFNSVSTGKVRLTMNTTQTVDDEKSVGQLRCFSEIGTVEINPVSMQPNFQESSVAHDMEGGGNVFVSFGERYETLMEFNDSGVNDLTLFRTLKNRGVPFYTYPSGGLTTRDQEGFRVQDMYYTNFINNFSPSVKSNIFGIGTIISLHLREV